MVLIWLAKQRFANWEYLRWKADKAKIAEKITSGFDYWTMQNIKSSFHSF